MKIGKLPSLSTNTSTMNKKTLLVVGAGFGQVPAIEIGKEMGLKVLAVDRNPDAPGMELADESFVIDIIDKESILTVSKQNKIDGIITLQSDHGVPSVGYVNDYLGLKGISYETAINCSYKTRCRSRLKEKNCSQPKFRFVSTKSEATKAVEEIGIPSVIKASDSSGSRGITKVSTLEEIENGVKEAFKYTIQEQIIVEEYIDGVEFGAQTFSVDGKCEVVLLHNDTLSKPPYMIPIGHSFPFKDLAEKEVEFAKESIKKAVETIGITDGPANIDIILDNKSKEVKIIELGARIGATCLPELVYYHTGINWVKEAIKSAIGEKVNLNFKDPKPVAAQIISANKDGIFKGYNSNLNAEKYEVIEFEISAKKGERVSKLRKGTDRIGKAIAFGLSADEATNNVSNFLKNVNIEVENE